jgi:hypothetical protein
METGLRAGGRLGDDSVTTCLKRVSVTASSPHAHQRAGPGGGDLVGWDGAEISWDAFGYCVTWPTCLAILGLAITGRLVPAARGSVAAQQTGGDVLMTLSG